MKHIHNEAKKKIDLYTDEGVHVGEIEYMNGGNNELYATHTEVFKGHEGQGHGRQLLDALVELARSKDAKIVPICPYVIAEFKKNPEKYADVIKK